MNLVACSYFTLELVVSRSQPVEQDTAGETFHALTVIEGAAAIVPLTKRAKGHPLVLNQYDSAVVPAACGAYEIRPLRDCRILKASVSS